VDIDLDGDTGDNGAMWKVGETFEDEANNISVTVQSATTSGYVVTITRGSVPSGTPTATATVTRTPTRTPTPTPYLVRVNAGDSDYADTLGNLWSADRPFTTGDWGYNGGSPTSTSTDIANTSDDPLYQTDRAWPSSATPGYKFVVPTGQYEVTFKFAETVYAAPNQRQFNVLLEGAVVLPAFDIVATAGGKDTAAPDQVITVNVSDGLLNVAFTQIAGLANPKVNAIQVRQVTP